MTIFDGFFDPITFLIRIGALIIAFTVHELFHGLAAYWLGDSTAKEDGRLSLNPTKHIDPVGFLLIILVGFGWAKPVQVNIYKLKRQKLFFALIAFAGPLSNLLLAFLSSIILAFLLGTTTNFTMINTLFEVIGINIGLAVFNMLPIPPLDGGKVWYAVLPDSIYWDIQGRFASLGMPILVVLMLLNLIGVIIGPFIRIIFDWMFYTSLSIAFNFM